MLYFKDGEKTARLLIERETMLPHDTRKPRYIPRVYWQFGTISGVLDANKEYNSETEAETAGKLLLLSHIGGRI